MIFCSYVYFLLSNQSLKKKKTTPSCESEECKYSDLKGKNYEYMLNHRFVLEMEKVMAMDFYL